MPKKTPPTFNLLSIGHRGVGKSVFLAGCYAQLHKSRLMHSKGKWFEPADTKSRQILRDMLEYMQRSGRYPSATMKITDLAFKVKSRELQGDLTLCEFRWADIPGEICHLDNPDFKALMLNSHGCCVFMDAAALVRDTDYWGQIEETINQIEVISTLADQQNISYFFSLILTKCDQINADTNQMAEIEKKWESLNTRLMASNTVYRRFSTFIILVPTGQNIAIKTEGTADPILWLVSQLSEVYKTEEPRSVGDSAEPAPESNRPTTGPTASLSMQSKVVIALISVSVIASLGFGLGIILSNPEPKNSPDVEQSSSGVLVRG
ncbi:hypothetical protein C1752_02025 [Acaryochloris thomasi RCC1774]|uniref:Uncharacterized protein n=1 Tax=Acaryochloris thomasi RCC1774 TaxID=1764569 RepID=A0A2W1JZI3_9CYAN|nr:hypothetical protein [Acaryochloris thomasi]PZD73517.1 hypothetical protein C1752_02025 [Acaryochloris thomasi RCC1774]